MGGRIVKNPEQVDRADVIVGIPSYNEADAIAYPTDVAARGLTTFFPNYKSVIINLDNNSPDGTMDVFLSTPTKVPKIYISTSSGVKGKGNNIYNLFEAAVELQAKAVVMVDRLREELEAEPDLSNLYMPVGLDIGGQAPNEISFSILAEIQAHRYGREGHKHMRRNWKER